MCVSYHINNMLISRNMHNCIHHFGDGNLSGDSLGVENISIETITQCKLAAEKINGGF